jgi:Glycosyl hydrolases family 38 N-terminal domain/Glycosyl hydrolases family 38 C-terminal domain
MPAERNLPAEELLAGPTGVEVEWGDSVVRIGSLPLFRHAEEGLVQALRVVVDSPTELGPLTASVWSADHLLDRNSGLERVLLFVPEVDAPREVEVVVSTERGDELRTQIDVLPQRKWNLYLIHHSHLDIGYTDPQDLVLRHHLTYLDSALDLVDTTSSWPDAAQFRWNVEANWPLKYWLKSRPQGAIEAFFDRVRAGRIEVAALPYTMHTEAYSMDELARQLWFADELRERFDIRIDTAMQTDVPGGTMGLLTALVDADVRYLSVAHNYAGRSVPYLVGGRTLTRPFYWIGPDGRRLCVWYTDTPHGIAYMEGNLLGLASSYEEAADLLPEYLAALAQRAYPYRSPLFGWTAPEEDGTRPYPHDLLHLRVQGDFADNASPSIVPAEIVRRWSSEWAYPRIRLATNGEFFREAEERIGDSIEEFAGDWTDWWADGIGSAARPLGFNRRAQNVIRSAQTLNTLADHLSGAPDNGWSSEVSVAYEQMALFDEHTWGAANPWEDALDKMDSGGLQWGRKTGFAIEALTVAERLADAGLARLSPMWSAPSSAVGAIVVVNPSSRTRTDLVTVFVPASKVDGPIDVVDASAERVIPATFEAQEHPRHRARGRHVSFVAHDVPALGFAVYELRRASRAAPERASGETDRIANEHYEVSFDADEGCVAGIRDLASGRELVAAGAPFGFNQYIFDRYATAPHINHLSSRVQAVDLAFLAGRSIGAPAIVVERSRTAVWDRLTGRLEAEGVRWLEFTLTLLGGVKRIDIRNRMNKVATSEKHSAFFAFPFNADADSLRCEITGGVDSAAGPHVPGSAHHMRAVRHWVAARSGPDAIAWATFEAPLVQFGNLHLPYAPFPETLEPEQDGTASIYSWIVNNIWDTNFPSHQGGEMEFRYAVTSGSGDDPESLGRGAAAALTAPLLGMVATAGASPKLEARGTFCAIDREDVEVVALAKSRTGHDLVVQLQSHVADRGHVRIELPLLRIARAWKGSHLERHLDELPVDGHSVSVPVGPGELSTLVLDVGAA